MPGLVLGHRFEDFHGFGIDAGKGSMGGIAALGPLFDDDGQGEEIDKIWECRPADRGDADEPP